jgi:hypothetical protein
MTKEEGKKKERGRRNFINPRCPTLKEKLRRRRRRRREKAIEIGFVYCKMSPFFFTL